MQLDAGFLRPSEGSSLKEMRPPMDLPAALPRSLEDAAQEVCERIGAGEEQFQHRGSFEGDLQEI